MDQNRDDAVWLPHNHATHLIRFTYGKRIFLLPHETPHENMTSSRPQLYSVKLICLQALQAGSETHLFTNLNGHFLATPERCMLSGAELIFRGEVFRHSSTVKSLQVCVLNITWAQRLWGQRGRPGLLDYFEVKEWCYGIGVCGCDVRQ